MSVERVKLTKAQRKCLEEATRGCVHFFARGTYRRSTKEVSAFNSRTLLALSEHGLLERGPVGSREVFHLTPAGRAALAGEQP